MLLGLVQESPVKRLVLLKVIGYYRSFGSSNTLKAVFELQLHRTQFFRLQTTLLLEQIPPYLTLRLIVRRDRIFHYPFTLRHLSCPLERAHELLCGKLDFFPACLELDSRLLLSEGGCSEKLVYVLRNIGSSIQFDSGLLPSMSMLSK